MPLQYQWVGWRLRPPDELSQAGDIVCTNGINPSDVMALRAVSRHDPSRREIGGVIGFGFEVLSWTGRTYNNFYSDLGAPVASLGMWVREADGDPPSPPWGSVGSYAFYPQATYAVAEAAPEPIEVVYYSGAPNFPGWRQVSQGEVMEYEDVRVARGDNPELAHSSCIVGTAYAGVRPRGPWPNSLSPSGSHALYRRVSVIRHPSTKAYVSNSPRHPLNRMFCRPSPLP